MTNIVEIMRDFFRNGLKQELQTLIPGFVLSYNKKSRTAKVKISISDYKNCPEIEDVPVIFPCSREVGLFFNLKPNDPVLLLFSQKSIEEWLVSNGSKEIKPKDERTFDLTDCIAIPGLFPMSRAEPKIKIEFTEKGKIEIGGKSLKALVNESFLEMFANHVHISAAPTQPTTPPVDETLSPITLNPIWDTNYKTKILEAE